MIRNIIFDWSGTLVDDLPAVWNATNHVFRQAGLATMTLDRFRTEFCLPFQRFYDRFTPTVPMDQLEAWFHAHFRQSQHTVVEIVHAREFLKRCRERGVRLFVLSSVHVDHFTAQAKAMEFGDFFERVYAGVRDKREKVRELLEENHLQPQETLLIGDMEHDMETAKHGGVWSCAVLTGYTGLEALRASQPDCIVEHLAELLAHLEHAAWEFPGPGPTANAQRPVATVGALISDGAGRVLMIRTQKWSNTWGIPGGKIEYGEPAIDALRRELREETNLDVTDIEFVMVQDCIRSPEFYREAHFLLLNYFCRALPGREVKLNEEAQEFRWVTVEEAKDLRLNHPTRRLLARVADPKRDLQ